MSFCGSTGSGELVGDWFARDAFSGDSLMEDEPLGTFFGRVSKWDKFNAAYSAALEEGTPVTPICQKYGPDYVDLGTLALIKPTTPYVSENPCVAVPSGTTLVNEETTNDVEVITVGQSGNTEETTVASASKISMMTALLLSLLFELN